MKTRLLKSCGAAAFALLLGAALAGCASADRPESSIEASADRSSSAPQYSSESSESSSTSVPRDRFTTQNFGAVTRQELGEKLGVDLGLPDVAAGAQFEGIYEPRAVPGMEFYAAVYSNDVIVYVTVLPTEEDAKEWLGDYIEPPFSEHVTKMSLQGVEAYSIPRLDVEPSFDPTTGLVIRGTGVSTGTAKVIWRRGRFVVSVMNKDKSVAELETVARDVTFEPR